MSQECHWCERVLKDAWTDFADPLRPTRDHVFPKSRGGRDTVLCCNQCNGIKGDMLPDEWLDFMRANPTWWQVVPSTKKRGPVLNMELVFATFEFQNQVRKDRIKLEQIEWPWLRELVRPMVTSCGFGPWK